MKRAVSTARWVMELFNPPLRESLTTAQKMGRVLLVTATLVTLCIITALGLAVMLFVYDRGSRFLASEPELTNAVTILCVSAAVNLGCVFALLQIKRVDQRLMAPTSEPGMAPPRDPRA